MASTLERPIGLKILYDASSSNADRKSLVDIVAVHGLGAHPDLTWTKSQVNWLQDEHMLQAAVPNTRILRFGYESQWLGKEAMQQRLSLVSDQLLHCLLAARKLCPCRPIVFVGHCFGGLVIEKAILNAKLHEEDFPSVIQSVAGIVFLGTPHRGSNSQSAASLIVSIASAVNLGEHSSLLKSVEKDSEILVDLLYDFTRVANISSISLFCFFEQHKSDIAKVIRPAGTTWPSMKDTVVDERSGCIDGFPKLGLACDHFQLNKFADSDDKNYQYVRNEIVNLVETAPNRVHHRIQPLGPKRNTNRVYEKQDQDCLAEIFVTDPADDVALIQNKNKVMKDTGAWILSDPAFSTWVNCKSSNTLWIHGDPGKGKTMLAISMVKALTARIQLDGANADAVLCYFFCDSKDDRRKTTVSILRGLIYQLLCQRPDLTFHLRLEYERQKEHLLSSPNSLQSLWRVFQTIIKSSDIQKAYIVLDGLDECEPESMGDLLNLLEPQLELTDDMEGASRREPWVIRWLLTSRNEEHIRQSLYGCLDIGLEQNTDQVNASIDQFINEKVNQLQNSKHYSPALVKFVEESFREKAEGTFLWVALAYQKLSDPRVPSINTKRVLNQLPSGLTPLYTRILEQILGHDDPEMVEYARAILQAMVAALRPLRLAELAVISKLPKDVISSREALEEYVTLCGSFVAVRQDTAFFVHSSAKSYLLTVDAITSSGMGSLHCSIAVNCISYLCDEDINDTLVDSLLMESFSTTSFVDSGYGGSTVDEVPFDIPLEPKESRNHGIAGFPRAEYPVLFWLEHARLIPDELISEIDLSLDFFQPKSKLRRDWLDLYWGKKHAPWEKKPSDFTALHLGAYGGLAWLVSSILKSQPHSVASTDSLGNDAMMWASRNGHRAVVKLLLEGEPRLSSRNLDGVTALYLAADNGHYSVVSLLAEHGASVELRDKVGWTPLHRAAHGGHSRTIQVLLDHGAQIEAQDSSRWTALQRAVSSGQQSVVRLLLEKGANAEVRDREGLGLLHLASWNGHTELASMLLRRGSDVEVMDDMNWNSIQHAAWNGHILVAKLLISRGANLDAQNVDGNTALHHATWNGHVPMVKLLLSEGADPNIRCDNGETILQQAAWRGHLDVAKILLASEINVDVKSNIGNTALHQAASNGQEEMVRLLLDAGADPTIKDNDEQTARMIAETNHHDSTAQLLKERTSSNIPTGEADPTSDEEDNTHDIVPLDWAIVDALPIKPDTCKIEPHGQAGFSNPSKITATTEGKTSYYFVKSGPNKEMFKGEHDSLEALFKTVPGICPKTFAYGKLKESSGYFLLTEFVDVNDRKRPLTSGLSLPQKLARLHKITAPNHPERHKPMFGFPTTTYCGSTPQSNTFRSSWSKFFAEDRLRAISKIIEENHGTDDELRAWIERIVLKAVPKLLRNGHLGGRGGIQPVLVHGDLWSGNKARGAIGEDGAIEDVIFDPSCCYAHSEYELGIMRMFGGFSAGFFNEYHRLVPKSEPKNEYEDRMELYQLYHYLNHYALFCGGYRDDAIDNMKKLWEKYQEEEEEEEEEEEQEEIFHEC